MAASTSSLSGTDDDDGEHLSIGSTLECRSSYRIDEMIGTGGMGRIYRAEHTGIGRAVAIKILHNDLSSSREAAQRFQREAIASSRLDHPNIIGIYDFGELPHGACYLVMELLEGETLGARLEREGRIPWREALQLMRGLLAGLRHAHDRGVVHRDIKPENIFLARKDGDLTVKILDFGIAKLRAGNVDDPASTRTGLTVGTPAYVSPEQAVGGEITPASDLYSASIVLYEMLAGRGPFEDTDPLALLGAHISKMPPPVRQTAPEIEMPPGLEAVIQAGLVKIATARILSAQEYIEMLDRVLESMRRFRTAPIVESPPELPPAGSMTPVTPPHGSPSIPAGQGMISVERTPLGEAPRQALVRAPSIAEDSDPIPRRWIVISACVIAALVIGALILHAMSSDSRKPSGRSRTQAEDVHPRSMLAHGEPPGPAAPCSGSRDHRGRRLA